MLLRMLLLQAHVRPLFTGVAYGRRRPRGPSRKRVCSQRFRAFFARTADSGGEKTRRVA